MRAALEAGELVAGRFEIIRAVGQGGMGLVFRARDRSTGADVALKLMQRAGEDEGQRFEREGSLLSELRHPHIVEYVGHGQTAEGVRYLAMQWLDGEDLGQRLRRGALGVGESARLLLQAASALDVAHRRGIVHRDVKPSNLFLQEHRLDRLKMLDFGIARRGRPAMPITRTGVLVGTPEYMAPEQARGERELRPSADVFSLGCVIYECITGRPPFGADSVSAVLLRVLFETPPPLHQTHGRVPAALGSLVSRMLAKEPSQRPPDAVAVLAELSQLGPLPLDEQAAISTIVSVPPPAEAEQALCCVVIVAPDLPPGDDGEQALRGLSAGLSELGARAQRTLDGTLVMTADGAGDDPVVQAARCALWARGQLVGGAVVMATGRGAVREEVPVGEAIQRATELLGRLRGRPAGAGVWLDALSAALLDGHFLLEDDGGEHLLVGTRSCADETRRLLGKPTPCVGRERELSMLDLMFAECRDESVARLVVVTGPPGMGKSRLRHEFVRRLVERGEPATMLLGRGDPLRAGSRYGLLAAALRRLWGVQEGEAPALRRQKLRQRAGARLPERERGRIVDFLGELCGIPSVDEGPLLRAARQEPSIMAEQITRAFVDFLGAECDTRPHVLILEDLHWGDPLTVRLVEAALRDLSERPLMVLALARPDVDQVFPRLWAERRQDLRLEGLPRRACERFVAQVLGEQASAGVTARLVRQAAGNALFLEELIRAVAEGKGDELPESVLAMLQGRLGRLPAGGRRVLRLASVFGETFWRGGVRWLLHHGAAALPAGRPSPGSAEPHDEELDGWLKVLVEAELIERRRESRFPGEVEFAFRHSLMREAAYGLLDDEQRRQGHRLSAQFLEAAGEGDAAVLAGHFERGGEAPDAARCYLGAAEQAHRGGDAEGALSLARRGLGCGPPEALLGALHGLVCQVHLWRGQWSLAAACADEVLRRSAPATAPWSVAAAAKLLDIRRPSRPGFVETLDALCEAPPPRDAVASFAFALALGVFLLDVAGEPRTAEVYLAHLRRAVEPTDDALARAWMHRAQAHREAWVNEDAFAGLRHAEAARAGFVEANHRRGEHVARAFVGMNAWLLGDAARAEHELRATLDFGEDLGLVSSLRSGWLVQVLLERGALDEARSQAEALAEAGRAQGQALNEGQGRFCLALALLQQGELACAERECQQALPLLVEAPADADAAAAALAAIQLRRGDVDASLASAEQALAGFRRHGLFGLGGAQALLTQAEALAAAGRVEPARQALRQAAARLEAQADRIHDPALRSLFLRRPEHQRAAALAAAWG